jgi:hypothetical protein
VDVPDLLDRAQLVLANCIAPCLMARRDCRPLHRLSEAYMNGEAIESED